MNDCPGSTSGEQRLEQILRAFAENRIDAAEDLRRFLSPGLRWFLRRKAAEQGIEKLVDHILGNVLEALRSGQLGSAAEVQSFMRFAVLETANSSQGNKPASPAKSQIRSMRVALDELSACDQEAIKRHLRGENAEQICADLQISPQQLSIMRSRLKARFTEIDCLQKPTARGTISLWLRAHTN